MKKLEEQIFDLKVLEEVQGDFRKYGVGRTYKNLIRFKNMKTGLNPDSRANTEITDNDVLELYEKVIEVKKTVYPYRYNFDFSKIDPKIPRLFGPRQFKLIKGYLLRKDIIKDQAQ